MCNQPANSNPAKARSAGAGTITLALIAANVAMFIFQNAAEQLNLVPVYRQFALSLDGLRNGHLWQLISFQFLHLRLADGGAFHLLGNVFLIKVFGSAVEEALGKGRFLGLYLLSGTLGGLLQVAAGWLAPGQFGTAVVGASAGACGLLAAHATLFPRRPVHLFFSPVTARADVLFALVLTGTVAGLFLPTVHVAHAAHLGGMMTGFLLARAFWPVTAAPVTVKSPLNSGTTQSYI